MITVALIPLRGGSKSIPKKNFKSLAGNPLSAWTLEAAAGSAQIGVVYVSTDRDEIADVVQWLGLGVKSFSALLNLPPTVPLPSR